MDDMKTVHYIYLNDEWEKIRGSVDVSDLQDGTSVDTENILSCITDTYESLEDFLEDLPTIVITNCGDGGLMYYCGKDTKEVDHIYNKLKVC